MDPLALHPLPDRPAPLRAALLAWFDAHARALPWRENTDPYRVWISEVMLQQTRVDAVIPFYTRWMDRFPDLDALATASEQSVLQMWAGLGYYSRGRNLHRAARWVRERHGGALPRDPGELRALPGVGEYTAGAVASIAFGIPLPAVDGNVRRVLARLMDVADPSPGALRNWAGALVDPLRPGDFNQAVMELGATVCTPRAPSCPRCPVEHFCRAAAAGTQGERPAPRRKGKVREVAWGVVVLVAGEGVGARTLVRRRPPEGLLGGMWEFPSVEVGVGATVGVGRGAGGGVGGGGGAGGGGSEEEGAPARPPRIPEAVQVLRRELSGDPATVPGAESAAVGLPLSPVPHLFSHIRAVYHPFLWRVEGRDAGGANTESDAGSEGGSPGHAPSLRWIPLNGEAGVPLPAAQQRILGELRRLLTPPTGSGE
jgi:A/G-specific adenine glycosylase